MKKPMNVAVIGCGMLARSQHIPNIAKSEKTVLHTCCDLSDAALEECRDKHGALHTTKDYHAAIQDPEVDVIMSTGGTGIGGRDSTPEAILPLLDKPIEGFGELFRAISMEEIGASAIQSRAVAGLTNKTLVFCLPGSTGACRTGWGKLISHQLDYRTRPCNLVELMPRVLEK